MAHAWARFYHSPDRCSKQKSEGVGKNRPAIRRKLRHLTPDLNGLPGDDRSKEEPVVLNDQEELASELSMSAGRSKPVRDLVSRSSIASLSLRAHRESRPLGAGEGALGKERPQKRCRV